MDSQELKHQKWNNTESEVRKMRDGLNMPIDKSIQETVTALNALGIHTRMSCGGHLDRFTHGPYVMFGSQEAREYENLCKEIENRASPEYKKASQQAKQLNLRQRSIVLAWLDDFYKKRDTPHSQRLIVQEIGHEISYLYCQNSCLTILESQTEREKALQANRAEMQAFTEYLKNLFFKV